MGSKAHDSLNNTFTGVHDSNTGVAIGRDYWGNALMDVLIMSAMLPAAYLTALLSMTRAYQYIGSWKVRYRLPLAFLVSLSAISGCFDPGYSLRLWREKLVVNSTSVDSDGVHFAIGVSRMVLVDECKNDMQCLASWIERKLKEMHVCHSEIDRVIYIQNGGEIAARGVCDVRSTGAY